MRARLLATGLLGCAVALGACTGSSDPTTTTEGVAPTTTVPATTTTTVDPFASLELPVDPDIVTDVLDNGLTYYIKYNDSPGSRVELRLLVDAGSIQEDEDQAGMAHFLEHMMFNGTERFPRNELIDVLEAFGPRFGPDINAHTNFDETVYELSLASDANLVALGLEVLREWASRATLTETDVVEERGIVLDEWRLRAQGFDARAFDALQELILTGSAYEGHLPIGTEESISGTSPQELRRYYEDWYRPERMAIVAVGDFDVAEMEILITETFSDIAPDGPAREFEVPEYERPNEARAGSLVDSEAASASFIIRWPVPAGPVATAGDLERAVALNLAFEILSNRLNEDSLEPGSPLLDNFAVGGQWARSLGVHGLDVDVRPEVADEGLEKILREIERVRRFGVTSGEFDRAVAGYAAVVEQIHSQQATRQDFQIASQISGSHLDGQHLMSPDQAFEIQSQIAERLTVDFVNEALVELVSGHPIVLAIGPDDVGASIPDESAIQAAIAGMAGLTLEQREPLPELPSELMARPDPAEILDLTIDPQFGFAVLSFENGATVYLFESQIATEAVFGIVEGFGGTSVIPVDEIPEANLMVEIAATSGLGDFNEPDLRRFLSDKLASIFPYVTETRQGIEANAAVSDTETMFQLIHLAMTQPRFDQSAIDAAIDETETVIASKDDLPDLLFAEAIDEGYYGDDPRYAILPTQEQLDEFDAALAESLYRDRFSNAGDFAYVFVGDFDSAEMVNLAASYIGTLPGEPGQRGFVDNQPLPPREVQVTTLEAGIGNQGQVGMFFTNEFEPTVRDRLSAKLAVLILSARLRDVIREELGGTYSIRASIDLQRDPDPFAEAAIISTGPPEGLEIISEEIVRQVADMQGSGLTLTEFATGVEQLRDELELINNRTIAEALVTSFLYPDQPFIQLAEEFFLIDEMDMEDVISMLNVAFNLDQRIEVRQVPLP